MNGAKNGLNTSTTYQNQHLHLALSSSINPKHSPLLVYVGCLVHYVMEYPSFYIATDFWYGKLIQAKETLNKI